MRKNKTLRTTKAFLRQSRVRFWQNFSEKNHAKGSPSRTQVMYVCMCVCVCVCVCAHAWVHVRVCVERQMWLTFVVPVNLASLQHQLHWPASLLETLFSWLPLSSPLALTKGHHLGDLRTAETCFLSFVKSKIKASAPLVSEENTFPGSQTAPCSNALPGGRGKELWGSLLEGHESHLQGLHPHALITF